MHEMAKRTDGVAESVGGGRPTVVLPGLEQPRDPARALKVGPHGMPREEVERNQRERLIDAFVQLVALEGYEAAGVKTTCQRAGVSYNAFYEHFGTKDALYLAAYDAGVVALFTEAQRVTDNSRDEPWAARVEAGLGSFLGTLTDNPLFARFFTVEIHKASTAVQRRVDEVFEESFRLVGRADRAADIGLPAEHLGPLVIGGIYTRIYFYIRTGRTAELMDLLPVLTRFVLIAFDAPHTHK